MKTSALKSYKELPSELKSGEIKDFETLCKLFKTDSNIELEEEVKEETEYYRKFKHLKLSIEEFDKLKLKYSKQQIDNTLDKIENYKQNTKYNSLYLTLSNWLKKESKEKSPTSNHSF